MTDPVLQAALEGEAPFLFGACEIQFPGYTLRVLDGSGELTIGGNLFQGTDPTFGVLDTISGFEETIGDEAPSLTFSFLPPDEAAAVTLASSAMQGSKVWVTMGAYDPTSNLVIGTPEILFYGEIDVPTLDLSQSSISVSYAAVTVFERLFEVDEGERAADGWHQSIWPGEKGFEYVTGTVQNLYWGAKRPVPTSVGTPSWIGRGGIFNEFEQALS